MKSLKDEFESKFSIDYDKLIEELKSEDPYFKDFDINPSNLNDFLIIKDERKNCKNCSSLESCKNISKGYIHNCVTGNFSLSPCKFKQIDEEVNSKKNLFQTKYIASGTKDASLENFKLINIERKKALKYAKTFIEEYDKDKLSKGLYLYGAFGTGKTYFLAGIAKELSLKGVRSLLIYFPELCRILKQNMYSDNLEDLINELKTVDVLMIDDLGGEVLTSWIRDEILGVILNYRISLNKPVFISSNLNIEELFKHLSQTKEEAYSNTFDNFKAGRVIERIKQLTVAASFGENNFLTSQTKE